MKKWLTALSMTWGMFCAIPCPVKRWDNDLRASMLVCLPVMGAVIGCVWAAVYLLLGAVSCPRAISAAILTFTPYLLTGFIHLDGFMDCCDAILSRRDLEERQRILKDPTTGSFAVICMVAAALAGFALFFDCRPERPPVCLALIPATSRCCSSIAVQVFQPIGHSSYAAMHSKGINRKYVAAVAAMLAAVVILPAALCFPAGLCTAATACACALTVLYCRRQLDGMSGDISGCAITVGELCGAAVFVLL